LVRGGLVSIEREELEREELRGGLVSIEREEHSEDAWLEEV
jgi:hypothetical protein